MEYPSHDKMKNIGIQTIKSNITPFVLVGLNNYYKIWQVGAAKFAVKFQNASIPFFDDKKLNEVGRYIYSRSLDNLSIFVLISFIALGFSSNLIFFILSIILIKKLWTKELYRAEKFLILSFSLLLVSLCNIFFVSYANTPLTRYLMPHFPLLILSNISFLLYLFNNIKARD